MHAYENVHNSFFCSILMRMCYCTLIMMSNLILYGVWFMGLGFCGEVVLCSRFCMLYFDCASLSMTLTWPVAWYYSRLLLDVLRCHVDALWQLIHGLVCPAGHWAASGGGAQARLPRRTTTKAGYCPSPSPSPSAANHGICSWLWSPLNLKLCSCCSHAI